MPQPVKPSSWSLAPGSTLTRPAISVAITAVLAEWTWVEHDLVGLVGNAMGASTDPKNGKFAFTTNMMALDVMATAENVRSRIALFGATIGRLLEGSQLEERGANFLKDLRHRSRERNRIAHAIWMVSSDFPDDLIEYDPKSKAMFRWTEKDVKQSLDRIISTREEAHNLLMAIVAAVHRDDLVEREFGPRRA